MAALDVSIRRLADYGVRVVLVQDGRRRRFRLYQELAYDHDGVHGEKMIRDWSRLSELPLFIEGMLAALAVKCPAPED